MLPEERKVRGQLSDHRLCGAVQKTAFTGVPLWMQAVRKGV